jgi:alkaline phosphatase D
MFQRSLLAFAALVVTLAAPAQDVTPVIHIQNPLNLLAQQNKHYVVLVSLDGFRFDYTEGALLYADNEADDAERAYEQFRAHVDPRFTAYRRADVPKSLNYDSRISEGDPVIVANGPYAIYAHQPSRAPNIGSHGFDPQRVPQMKAIFYAEGPDIKAGVQLPSFDNIDVFPFIAALLGLNTPLVDGVIGPLALARQ